MDTSLIVLAVLLKCNINTVLVERKKSLVFNFANGCYLAGTKFCLIWSIFIWNTFGKAS